MAYPLIPVEQQASTFKEIAIQALAGQGEYGLIAELTRQYGISRSQVRDLRERAKAALDNEFADSKSEDMLFPLTKQNIKRAIIGLRVVGPNSIRDIVALLPIPYGKHCAYGTIWQVLHEAEQRAEAFLSSVDLSGIHNVALDEMFSQGNPVFGGIDLDTQYLFQLQKQPSRTGEDWALSLSEFRDEQNLFPERVVKDAGSGLAKGVEAVWPHATVHDDLFHAVYMMGKEAYHLERRAYLNVHRRCHSWEQKERNGELSSAVEHLLDVTGNNPEKLLRALKAILPVLIRRYRASSAIENLNSVLRPYVVVHKNVEQGFLNLFQFYWNMRKREWGRGKGTSAYEQLTGQRVDDWLTLLGYPPDEKYAAAA